MNLRVFASASALAMVVGVAGVASAQTKAGAASFDVTANWDPSIGGTMHEGGSGKVLGLTTVVNEKTWSDTHKQSGFLGSAGVGIGLNDKVEAVGNVEFGTVGAQQLQVGTVATLPLFAQFDDYKVLGPERGGACLSRVGQCVSVCDGHGRFPSYLGHRGHFYGSRRERDAAATVL